MGQALIFCNNKTTMHVWNLLQLQQPCEWLSLGDNSIQLRHRFWIFSSHIDNRRDSLMYLRTAKDSK